jgi:phosphoribosylanthranilate isomerase
LSTPPKIKICGVTQAGDAELAVELGAWAIGMIFYDGSPRRCSFEQAQEIAAAVRRKAELCGVFVNAPLDVVLETYEQLGLDLIQLHGDEGPTFCAEVERRTGIRVIKAAQVGGPGDVRNLDRFNVGLHLFDTQAKSPERRGMRGGTGETFDWNLLRDRHSSVPLLLSGGIHSGNVVEAIRTVRPYGICSASWTEMSPGRKDPAAMRALFDAVASAVGGPVAVGEPV